MSAQRFDTRLDETIRRAGGDDDCNPARECPVLDAIVPGDSADAYPSGSLPSPRGRPQCRTFLRRGVNAQIVPLIEKSGHMLNTSCLLCEAQHHVVIAQ